MEEPQYGTTPELLPANEEWSFATMVKAGDQGFRAIIERWTPAARGWDVPKLDESFMTVIEARRAAAVMKMTQPMPDLDGMDAPVRHCPNSACPARMVTARSPFYRSGSRLMESHSDLHDGQKT